ncbi:MAG: hypothetical protein Q4F65_11860 [Propionibacteriaceae bacterium]|nr:hypothetical protein [Propionibacteriaceae bacterium]
MPDNWNRSEDPELRELLDSIGWHADPEPTLGEPIPDRLERQRGERMLAHIYERAAAPARARPSSHRPWWRAGALSIAAAASLVLLVSMAMLINPWAGTRTAQAGTPPLLRFEGVDAGHIPARGGPADAVLEALAARAKTRPEPAALPVQHIELESWWATTAASGGEGNAPRSVLVPVRSSNYVLPNGEFRSIEYRDNPLDEDGHIADTRSLDQGPPISDTTIRRDPGRGSDYADTLPQDPDRLSAVLAPAAQCPDGIGECLVEQVITLHTGYVLKPELTASMWTALQRQSDITYLGTTTDRHGRSAQVLSTSVLQGSNQILILADPATGAFLGYERILTKPNPLYGFDPPAVLDFTLVITADRVNANDVPNDMTTRHL